MSSKKVFVDLGSSYTSIYTNILLLREPTCIVIKNGFSPKVIATGEQAMLKKHLLAHDEQFVYPIMEGAVMHFIGAVLMIKEYLSKVATKKSNEITIYFSCGITPLQRQDLEKVFLEAGYKNVVMVEKILSLKPYVASFGNMVVVDIGASHSDVGIINEEGIVVAYHLNMGGTDVTNRIINTVERLYNLNITFSAAEKIKIGIGSLYECDTSRMTISGRDVISGTAKTIEVYSTDFYEDIAYCYKRIIKVLEGLLVVAPLECIEGITQRGVFVIGGGTKIKGLDDFIFRMLALPLKFV